MFITDSHVLMDLPQPELEAKGTIRGHFGSSCSVEDPVTAQFSPPHPRGLTIASPRVPSIAKGSREVAKGSKA